MDINSLVGKTWDAPGSRKSVIGYITYNGQPKLVIGREGSNTGINQVIDPSELEVEILRDTTNHESWLLHQYEKEKQEQAELAKKADVDDVDGYTDAMTPHSAQKAKNFLASKIQSGNMVLSIRDYIRQKVSDGASLQMIDGKYYLSTPSGFFVSAKHIGKTGIEYARYLAAKRQSQAR